MSITNIKARKATLKFSASAVTFDTGTALSGETYGTTIISGKDVTLTFPKTEVEQVPLLGESTVTIGVGNPRTGVFQNAFMDEKNTTNAMLSGTLVLTGDEVIEGLMTGSGTAITGSYIRYSIGDSTATTGARPTIGAILVDFNNGSEQVSAVLSNVYANFGELKPTGADGHIEVGFEANCLPENFAWEYKD